MKKIFKYINGNNVSKRFTRAYLILLILLLFFGNLSENIYGKEIFTTPDNLRDNVAFWKKIYTEISLKDGIVHDRDYPMIIYKTLTIGKRRGRKRRYFIRGHINQIKQWLSHIINRNADQWSSKEREIAALFTRYASLAEVKTARKRIRFQQGQRERYKEGLERSGAYMPHIIAVFRKYKIPPRIAYLPHVESSFNRRAYSRVGAAGMWQFMRSTGRLFMRINYRVDERFDPYKATVAAAKLLTLNYKKLKSWPLAITAYNHGLASMQRAVRVTGSRDMGIIIDKYKNRRFKFASKNFYGCFLAASEIAANPTPYFSNINYHKPPGYTEIPLKKYYRPKTLAKSLGITQEQLKQHNPALRSIVFRRQLTIPRGFVLKIPQSLDSGLLRQKLTALPAASKKKVPRDSGYYSVKPGDTLYRISRIFNVSTESLIIANEISRENRIYIGQVLQIPGRSPAKKVKPKRAPVKPKITPKPSTVTAVKTQPLPKPEPSAGSPETTTGEPQTTTGVPGLAKELPSILKPFQSMGLELKKAEQMPVPLAHPEDLTEKTEQDIPEAGSETVTNNKKNARISKKVRKRSSQVIFDATLYNLETRISSNQKIATVKVSLGETLGHFADWLGTSVSRIRRLNRGRRNIRVNQTMRVPLKNNSSLQVFDTKRLEYHMALEEDFYGSYRVVDTKQRTVEYGDTLWSICNRDEEIPIWLLKKYNRTVNLDALKVKMRLTIPVINPIN